MRFYQLQKNNPQDIGYLNPPYVELYNTKMTSRGNLIRANLFVTQN